MHLMKRLTGWLNPFTNTGESTLASPSAELVHALVGLPAASGKVVTRETAIRVASFLGGVKMLSSDIAKMPLVLRQAKLVSGRQRTQPAIDDPLYSLLKDCPNSYQTSYQMRWFLASQLIMQGNCYCQKITDQAGDVIGLVPLNAWHMTPHWDRGTNPPVLMYRYTAGEGTVEFRQDELWHVSSMNLEGFGLEGSPIILLAKEALSHLMAAEEISGRNFANGLSMGGFISFPDSDNAPDEKAAQNIMDRLRKDFSGSQNAGKFSMIPGGGKWEKMTFNSQEMQLLETRKWSEQEVVRLLGGAPLLVKMGLGDQNSTYASSSAFLDEYFNTSLLPYTTAIEQSITRDLIPRKKWGKMYAKHSADIILRGSPKERAETNAILINSWQMTPNEGRAIEDRDAIDGGDFLYAQNAGAIFNPSTGEYFIPGQMPPELEDPIEDSTDANESDSTEPPLTPKKTKRLKALAESAVERIERKAAKSELDVKFVASVLVCSDFEAEQFCSNYKMISAEEIHAQLLALAEGD